MIGASQVVVVVLVAQSCPTFCSPIDCSLPGSSVHGILQIRILEWVAISFPTLLQIQTSIEESRENH